MRRDDRSGRRSCRIGRRGRRPRYPRRSRPWPARTAAPGFRRTTVANRHSSNGGRTVNRMRERTIAATDFHCRLHAPIVADRHQATDRMMMDRFRLPRQARNLPTSGKGGAGADARAAIDGLKFSDGAPEAAPPGHAEPSSCRRRLPDRNPLCRPDDAGIVIRADAGIVTRSEDAPAAPSSRRRPIRTSAR